METHILTLFRKTGAGRRAQLARIGTEGGAPGAESPPIAAAGRGGSDLFADALRGLTDRWFTLFDERMELSIAIGEQDGRDTIVERRWTEPKP